MSIMKSFRHNFRGNRNWPLPAIIVQSTAARYTPPENPAGYLQVMQALNVTDDQVGGVWRRGDGQLGEVGGGWRGGVVGVGCVGVGDDGIGVAGVDGGCGFGRVRVYLQVEIYRLSRRSTSRATRYVVLVLMMLGKGGRRW